MPLQCYRWSARDLTVGIAFICNAPLETPALSLPIEVFAEGATPLVEVFCSRGSVVRSLILIVDSVLVALAVILTELDYFLIVRSL